MANPAGAVKQAAQEIYRSLRAHATDEGKIMDASGDPERELRRKYHDAP